MNKKIHLNIGGMTCTACQDRIENGLKTLKGVKKATVSFSKGTADVLYDDTLVSEGDIKKVIKKLDYKVLKEPESSQFNFENASCTLIIIIALYYLLSSTGILNRLVPKSLADTGMGYGMLFVIGLITSVHCIAMCGGIGLSQSLPKKKESGEEGKFQAFIPTLTYNIGRVCSYTAIGFLLGLVGMILGGGTSVGVSSLLQGILKIIAGLFMTVMGINMLGIFPWLRKFTIRPPKFILKTIGKKKQVATAPFVVGLLNGLMPCGPLQSMWIVALASANPFAGALSMFAFSLGTVPLMLGLGSIVSLLGKKFADRVMEGGSILVVVLGLSMLSQGGELSGMLPSQLLFYLIIACALSGVLISLANKNKQMKVLAYAASIILILGARSLWTSGQKVSEVKEVKATQEVEVVIEEDAEKEADNIVDGVQIVNSTLTLGRYPDITVTEGIPVRWTINAPEGSLTGCNYRMIIPEYGLEHTFEYGENVIEFTPQKSGTVGYTCWMGMVRGTIFVTEADA